MKRKKECPQNKGDGGGRYGEQRKGLDFSILVDCRVEAFEAETSSEGERMTKDNFLFLLDSDRALKSAVRS